MISFIIASLGLLALVLIVSLGCSDLAGDSKYQRRDGSVC